MERLQAEDEDFRSSEGQVEPMIRDMQLNEQRIREEHLRSGQRNLDDLNRKQVNLQNKASALNEELGKIQGERNKYQKDLDQLNSEKRRLQERIQKMHNMRGQRVTEIVRGKWAWHQQNEQYSVNCIDQQLEAEKARITSESKVLEQRQLEINHRAEESQVTKASNKVGRIPFMQSVMNEERMNHDSCRKHAESRASRSLSGIPAISKKRINEMIQKVLSQLNSWFETWDGHKCEAHQQMHEEQVWKLIQTASPYRRAFAAEVQAVADAWGRVSAKLFELIQDDRSCEALDAQVVFDLTSLAKCGNFSEAVSQLKETMTKNRVRPDVQESLLQKLEDNAHRWARHRLACRLFLAYESVQQQCPHWDFPGDLQQPNLPVVSPIVGRSFPNIQMPKFQEFRKGLSQRLSSSIQHLGRSFVKPPFPLEIPAGSVIEQKLCQGPGRTLRMSLQESWDAEFERAQESEVLAKQILNKENQNHFAAVILEENQSHFAALIFEEAKILWGIVLESWKQLLLAVSDLVPEDATGEAFKALQATCATKKVQRASLVALLSAPPGQHPDLRALNPFFERRGFGSFPRWTCRIGQSQIPQKLKHAISEIVQLQGLATSLCRVAQELKGEISATLQRQVADLLEIPCTSAVKRDEWLQFEWEQRLVCRPVQLHVATKMMSPDFDRKVLQLNMGEGKSKVILSSPQVLVVQSKKIMKDRHIEIDFFFSQYCHS